MSILEPFFSFQPSKMPHIRGIKAVVVYCEPLITKEKVSLLNK